MRKSKLDFFFFKKATYISIVVIVNAMPRKNLSNFLTYF